MTLTTEQANRYEQLMKDRPHVVILGAGATMAAIPNGDKNGRKSSVMNGFIESLGMTDVIKNANLSTLSNNLEDIYSELHSRSECEPIRAQLDLRIRKYFAELELPNAPNIYDLILLALRKKDLVATFNWDPLLLQAYQRASKITSDLPQIAFLHGNVLVGYCREHKQGGLTSGQCSQCGNYFEPAPLLYPVANKNYTDDPYIRDNWKAIHGALEKAYLVTIFGYSAPKTDAGAIALMEEAWGGNDKRNLEDFEFIDIRSEEDILGNWTEFVHSHHFEIHNSFFDSSLAQHPRRTTVELFDRTMNCIFTEARRKFNPNMGWSELELLINALSKEEENLPSCGFLSTIQSDGSVKNPHN
jgi:DNA-binding protein Fis